jgi:hypothetical protein
MDGSRSVVGAMNGIDRELACCDLAMCWLLIDGMMADRQR